MYLPTTLRQDCLELLMRLLPAFVTDVAVENFYTYKPEDLSSLVGIGVEAQGSEGGTHSAIHRADLHVFVAAKMTGWTQAQAEALLNTINAGVLRFIDAKRGKTTAWLSLDLEFESRVYYYKMQSGIIYIEEIYPLAFTVN